MRLSKISGIAVLAALCVSHVADASLTYTCRITSYDYFSASTSGVILDVWAASAGTTCLNPTTHNYATWNAMNATGLSQGNVEEGIRRAISVWNEESGSSLILRYRGTINACSMERAILLGGFNEDPYGTPICPGSGQSARSTETLQSATPAFIKANIDFFAWNQLANGTCDTSTPYKWTADATSPSTSLRFVGVLIHELGHAAYNIDDIKANAPLGDCENDSQVSVMSYTDAPNQTLGNWDLEVAQRRYGPRSNFSVLQKAHMLSSTSWFVPGTVRGQSTPNERRSQFSPTVSNRLTQRALAWVNTPAANTVPDGGQGYLESSNYAIVLSNSHNVQLGVLGRPPALTYRTNSIGGAAATLLAYERMTPESTCRTPPCTIYTSIEGELKLRISTNGGGSWGPEVSLPKRCRDGLLNFGSVCTSNSDCGIAGVCRVESTSKYGLSAEFNPATGNFIIAYSDSYFGTSASNQWTLRVLVVDGSGNELSATTLPYTSPHGPAISCANGLIGKCVLVYEGGDANSLLSWLVVHEGSGSSIVVDGAYQQGWYVEQAPTVADDEDASLFRMAYTSTSDAVYSYSMPFPGAPGTNTWTGTGDIYNNTSHPVSNASLSTRPVGSQTSKPYAWLTKYW